MLQYLSSLRLPDGELTLQPLTFDESDQSATVRALTPRS